MADNVKAIATTKTISVGLYVEDSRSVTVNVNGRSIGNIATTGAVGFGQSYSVTV